MRLDQHLVKTGRFESRARAQAAIRAGLVRVGGLVATKPSSTVAPDDQIEVAGDVHDYVSRGGVKLEAALGAFGVSPVGAVCLDLGASTGGFTDALLRAGACRVYAVDVGAGQLHASLAGDRRVVSLEKTHAKDLTRAHVPEPVDVLVCDLSFISVRKALAPALALCASGARAVVLIKPQFELGPTKIGKGGLVKAEPAEIKAMLAEIVAWLDEQGWAADGVIDSPIAGGDGNREFLLGARKKN